MSQDLILQGVQNFIDALARATDTGALIWIFHPGGHFTMGRVGSDSAFGAMLGTSRLELTRFDSPGGASFRLECSKPMPSPEELQNPDGSYTLHPGMGGGLYPGPPGHCLVAAGGAVRDELTDLWMRCSNQVAATDDVNKLCAVLAELGHPVEAVTPGNGSDLSVRT